MTYKEAIIKSLELLGGHAYYSDIYKKFQEIYDKELTRSWKNSIQGTIERYSSDSHAYKGGEDLFESVDGIGNGHWGLRNYNQELHTELTQEDDDFSEGKISLVKHLKRERNVKLIRVAKNNFIKNNNHLFCEICGFDFERVYGNLGKDFIEAHHMKPVSQMNDNEKTRVEDILMVCSNCHSMIHRKRPWLNQDHIKDILK